MSERRDWRRGYWVLPEVLEVVRGSSRNVTSRRAAGRSHAGCIGALLHLSISAAPTLWKSS